MKSHLSKWGVILVVAIQLNWLTTTAQVSTSRLQERLPSDVAERTKRQVQDYLGTMPSKGVPLLDPAIDWSSLSNWPNSFQYRGRTYSLEITDLSGEQPKRLFHRSQVKPGMVISVHYSLLGANSAVDNHIFPRGSWSKTLLPALALLHWGKKGFGETKRLVFMHHYYPTGSLHSFIWEDRASGEEHTEVYDRNGKLVGVAFDNDCKWIGKPVARDNFFQLKEALYKGGGVTSQLPARPGTFPPSPPLRNRGIAEPKPKS